MKFTAIPALLPVTRHRRQRNPSLVGGILICLVILVMLLLFSLSPSSPMLEEEVLANNNVKEMIPTQQKQADTAKVEAVNGIEEEQMSASAMGTRNKKDNKEITTLGKEDNENNVNEQMISILPTDVTIVTGYFQVPSKHGPTRYKLWMKNMLSLRDNMIIFTTSGIGNRTVNYIRNTRFSYPYNSDTNTHIVTLPSLDETLMIQDYLSIGGWDFWQKQNSLDPEKSVHYKELYVIWNEKSNFIRIAIEMNKFPLSKFYAWVDIGYFRKTPKWPLEEYYMIRQLPKTLRDDQVMLLDMRNKQHIGGDTVGGGFIGGYKNGIIKWSNTYYNLLKEQVQVQNIQNGNKNDDNSNNNNNQNENNKDLVFIGKDQPWMLHNCYKHLRDDLCILIDCHDDWFYMSKYLHG